MNLEDCLCYCNALHSKTWHFEKENRIIKNRNSTNLMPRLLPCLYMWDLLYLSLLVLFGGSVRGLACDERDGFLAKRSSNHISGRGQSNALRKSNGGASYQPC